MTQHRKLVIGQKFSKTIRRSDEGLFRVNDDSSDFEYLVPRTWGMKFTNLFPVSKFDEFVAEPMKTSSKRNSIRKKDQPHIYAKKAQPEPDNEVQQLEEGESTRSS